MLNKLSEMGWLFKKIIDFLNTEPSGLMNQAFCQAVKEELNEYYRLIAILENLRA